MKSIIIDCHIENCYWNVGQEFKNEGNCSCKQITLLIDHSQCSGYIDRQEAQAKLAQAAIRQGAKSL